MINNPFANLQSTIRNTLKFAFVAILFVLGNVGINAQQLEPSRWTFSIDKVTAESAELCFTVQLDAGWHIYSTRTDEGGPLPTEFHFTPNKNYRLKGGIVEPKPHEEFDDLFKVTVRDFSD